MKSNELRIGNICVDLHGYVCKIISIEAGNYQARKMIPLMMHPVFQGPDAIEAIKPIPLTEEWLVKFGFDIKTDLDIGRHCYENDIGKYNDSKHFEYIISSGDDSHGGWWYYTKEIEYVHQLQNLYFALTGEELILSQT
jgi:hypothetical protein